MKPFTIQCIEQGVEVTHTVEPYSFSVENIQRLYDKMAQFPVIFGRRLDSPLDFTNIFMRYSYPSNDPELNGLFFAVDNLETGVFYMTDVTVTDCTVHFAFFDKKVGGREKLVWNMLKKTLDHYGFQRLNAVIPTYVKPRVHSFIVRCGLVSEGRRRRSAYWKGDWFDEVLYGFLYNDLLKTQDMFQQTSEIENGTEIDNDN